MNDPMEYAVLEWDKGGVSGFVRVIATHQSKMSADSVVGVSPPYYEREAITMEEYQRLRDEEEELNR